MTYAQRENLLEFGPYKILQHRFFKKDFASNFCKIYVRVSIQQRNPLSNLFLDAILKYSREFEGINILLFLP